MTYPMNVRRVDFVHKGGTKAYHLLSIINATGQGVLVKRWGKVSSFGQIKVELYLNAMTTENALEAALRERSSRGYKVLADVSSVPLRLGELKAQVSGPVWAKLGATAVKHLDPSVDTTGMRLADEPDRDEDGVKIDVGPTLKPPTALELEKAERDARVYAEKLKRDNLGGVEDHPNFGRFA